MINVDADSDGVVRSRHHYRASARYRTNAGPLDVSDVERRVRLEATSSSGVRRLPRTRNFKRCNAAWLLIGLGFVLLIAVIAFDHPLEDYLDEHPCERAAYGGIYGPSVVDRRDGWHESGGRRVYCRDGKVSVPR